MRKPVSQIERGRTEIRRSAWILLGLGSLALCASLALGASTWVCALAVGIGVVPSIALILGIAAMEPSNDS